MFLAESVKSSKKYKEPKKKVIYDCTIKSQP